MSANYTFTSDPWSEKNPGGSKIDFVRKEIMDFDPNSKTPEERGKWELSDEIIQSFIDQNPENLYLAASDAARAIAAKYARKINKSIAGSSVDYSQVFKRYTDLADLLYERGTTRFKQAARSAAPHQRQIFNIGDMDMPSYGSYGDLTHPGSY